jgi:hypothetical protein
MSVFFAVHNEKKRSATLKEAVEKLNLGMYSKQTYIVNPISFSSIPGSPFSYWMQPSLINCYIRKTPLESLESDLVARRGVNTNADYRFFRLAWEVPKENERWIVHPKGGDYQEFYGDYPIVVDWHLKGGYLGADRVTNKSYKSAIIPSRTLYFRPGLTWSRRTSSNLSVRVVPEGCIFGDKGPAIIEGNDNEKRLLAICSLMNTDVFRKLVAAQLAAVDAAARSYEVGVIQKTPLPNLNEVNIEYLSNNSKEQWSKYKLLSSVNETSRAFVFPELILNKISNFNREKIVHSIGFLTDEINQYCSDLYNVKNISVNNNDIVSRLNKMRQKKNSVLEEELFSWIVGVRYGHFCFSIPEENFSLDSKNENVFESFDKKLTYENDIIGFCSGGVLLDDEDASIGVAEVAQSLLDKFDLTISLDMKKWFRSGFFSSHLTNYSHSRRQAPIYWPINTGSDRYTLWLYYHKLNNQTLFTCVNDFIEPKVFSVSEQIHTLGSKVSKTPDQEKELARLVDFIEGLKNCRDELLAIAPLWKPNLNDGVQITAAPLWKLFSNKTWQLKLKTIWGMLERGDYDWSTMAYNFWPERVLRKCHKDRSIAIAHDVEEHFWREVELPIGQTKRVKLVWQPREMTESELNTYIQQKIAQG